MLLLLYEKVNMRAALVPLISAAAAFSSRLQSELALDLILKLDQTHKQLMEVQHQHQDLLQLHAHLQQLRPCCSGHGGTDCEVVVARAGCSLHPPGLPDDWPVVTRRRLWMWVSLVKT